MVVIGVDQGVVVLCISCNSFDDVSMYFPDLLLSEQVGGETIGWTFDGAEFHAPSA